VQTQVFEEMKQVLKETISMERYIVNKFKIFAWEAGLGKSKFSTEFVAEVIIDAIGNESKTGIPTFLIVKKFKSDVEETVKYINSALGSFGDSGHKNDWVIGITSENWKELRKQPDKLDKSLVLVITHQRYIELCEAELPIPFGNRNTLIIDEKIQFPSYSYSKAQYDAVRPKFPYKLQKEFDLLNDELLMKLDELDTKGKNKISAITVDFDSTLIDSFLKQLKVFGLDSIKEVKEFFSELIFFYNQEIIYNNNHFYSYNKAMKLRKLKNNIILDASATLDTVYNGEDFVLIEKRRIVDYSKSLFIGELKNSSRSSIGKDAKVYMKDAVRGAANILESKRKCLYITHKSELKSFADALKELKVSKESYHLPNTIKNIEDEEIDATIELKDYKLAVNWYGNIVGQNKYSDFDMCHIIGTNNLPYPVYLIQYAIYNELESIKQYDLTIEKGKFKDIEMERIRQGFIAAEFYQAAKRIQRNENPQAIFILVHHDEHVINMIANEMNNVQFYVIERISDKDMTKIATNTISFKLAKHIGTLEIGKYKKKEIADVIGIDTKNLARHLKISEIQHLIEEGYIVIQHQSIEVIKKINS
jgi:hypothetical protein